MKPTHILLSLVALASAGCNLFDEDLYKNAEPLSDSCSDGIAAAPITAADLEGNQITLDIDTRGLADTKRQLATCTGSLLDGPEGFLPIEMLAGEKWHFHVSVLSSENDPAIYVLDSGCDDRACSVGDGIDICERGTDEHLSFLAPSDGTFLLAIDTAEDGGGLYELLAARPICGDADKDHSENCEDGNTADLDGCDSECRTELLDGSEELEPNDDFTGANRVLGADLALVDVRGVVGSLCDFDLYALEATAGASLTVTMDGVPVACAPGARPELELLGVDGHTVIAGSTLNANGCPELSAVAIANAGVYFVRVKPGTTVPAFDYDVHFRLTP